MSSANITPKQIMDAVQRVPEDRWPGLLQVIEGFQKEPVPNPPSTPPVRLGTDLHGSELIGIWADRTDITDSREFAQGLRRQAEQRN
jgi:hypothetical protein